MATTKTQPADSITTDSIAIIGTNGYGLDIQLDDKGQAMIRVRNTRTGKVHANVALGAAQTAFLGDQLQMANQAWEARSLAGYGDHCRDCGAHISEPHAQQCPSDPDNDAAPAPRKHRALATKPPVPARGKRAQLVAEAARIAGTK